MALVFFLVRPAASLVVASVELFAMLIRVYTVPMPLSLPNVTVLLDFLGQSVVCLGVAVTSLERFVVITLKYAPVNKENKRIKGCS